MGFYDGDLNPYSLLIGKYLMSLKAAKIGIVGAGNVGATLAYGLMLLRIGVTIILFDRTLSKAEGEAWDIEDAIPLCADLDVVPTDRYADLADSDVIGEHGDSELIVWSSVTIGAIPLTAFLTPEITLESLKQGYAEATRRRGYDILERKGHTSYGVATVVTQIASTIWRDANKIFTVSVRPHPGYQVARNVVLGLPCIIGKKGIERSLLLPLNAEEQKLLDRSALRLSDAYEKLVTS